MSMYKDFIESTTSWKIFEESNYYFTYKEFDNIFFIKSFYIKPDYRKSNLFLKMVRQCERLASEGNCKYISCQLFEENPMFKRIYKFCSVYGFFNTGFDTISASHYISKCVTPLELKAKAPLEIESPVTDSERV